MVRALALLALVAAPAAAFVPASARGAAGRVAPLAAKSEGFALVKPFNGDPTVGHLSTIVTSSGMTKSLMANLPCYRAGLDDKLRGLEVGLAHGYFFYGPFVTLGPLRASPIAPYAGLMSAIGLVLICSMCQIIYAIADEQENTPLINPKFNGGFITGGCGGAFFAFLLGQALLHQ